MNDHVWASEKERREELLRTAPYESVLEMCEDFCMNGFADEVSGNVEAPTGHFYRVGRYIVVTNSQGFNDLSTFDTEDAAKHEFEILDREYARWEDS